MECLRKKLAQDRDRRQGSKAFVFHPRGGREIVCRAGAVHICSLVRTPTQFYSTLVCVSFYPRTFETLSSESPSFLRRRVG